jgi:hypothetical protein
MKEYASGFAFYLHNQKTHVNAPHRHQNIDMLIPICYGCVLIYLYPSFDEYSVRFFLVIYN